MRPLAPALFLALAAAGCGSGPTGYTVSGRTLLVKEQNFSAAGGGAFCSNLATDQFQIVLSSAQICDQLAPDAGNTDGQNKKVIHSNDLTLLRLILPGASFIKVPPFVNEFKVGKSGVPDKCSDPKIPDDTQVVAWFSHNDPTTMKYDVNVAADSGKVVVQTYDKDARRLKGTFDLTFPDGKVVGAFDAYLCTGLVPGIGR